MHRQVMYIPPTTLQILVYLLNCSPMLSISVSIPVSISVSALIALMKPIFCSVQHWKIDYVPDSVESNYSLLLVLGFLVSTTSCIFVLNLVKPSKLNITQFHCTTLYSWNLLSSSLVYTWLSQVLIFWTFKTQGSCVGLLLTPIKKKRKK